MTEAEGRRATKVEDFSQREINTFGVVEQKLRFQFVLDVLIDHYVTWRSLSWQVINPGFPTLQIAEAALVSWVRLSAPDGVCYRCTRELG